MVLSLKLRPTRFVEHFSEQHSFCLAMPLVVNLLYENVIGKYF